MPVAYTAVNRFDPYRDDWQKYIDWSGLTQLQEVISLAVATERVYRSALKRIWRKGRPTQTQRRSANWLANKLDIDPGDAQRIDTEFAKRYFGVALARAMDDGILDDQEETHLKDIAAAAGEKLPEFARAYFFTEGEGFLRGVFLASVADERLSRSEWNNLIETSRKLGISRDELTTSIQPQARQFVEHVLADAKSDGRLSDTEEKTLFWLLENLQVPAPFRRYVTTEIALLRKLTDIQDGKLPIEPPPPGLALSAAEIVHFSGKAIWRHVRFLKSGKKPDDHHGILTMTDRRMVFSSRTKSHSIRYRRVVAYSGGEDWIEFQLTGKPASFYYFPDKSQIPYMTFTILVEMANQRMVKKSGGTRSRRIPRDVRQRVWQKYGGRCADCNADDYLEFDHIVPVAKGGSNSDANVQLLCRRCNLKKSDHI